MSLFWTLWVPTLLVQLVSLVFMLLVGRSIETTLKTKSRPLVYVLVTIVGVLLMTPPIVPLLIFLLWAT
jgi:hypothetical protein